MATYIEVLESGNLPQIRHYRSGEQVTIQPGTYEVSLARFKGKKDFLAIVHHRNLGGYGMTTADWLNAGVTIITKVWFLSFKTRPKAK